MFRCSSRSKFRVRSYLILLFAFVFIITILATLFNYDFHYTQKYYYFCPSCPTVSIICLFPVPYRIFPPLFTCLVHFRPLLLVLLVLLRILPFSSVFPSSSCSIIGLRMYPYSRRFLLIITIYYSRHAISLRSYGPATPALDRGSLIRFNMK